MKITLEVIPHKDQRLGAIGDWYFTSENDLVIHCSDLGDWRYNFLVLRHEMDEAMLCRHVGITTEMVDARCRESKRLHRKSDPDSFSGYPGAVHQIYHNDALAAEWIMSRLLGVDWVAYGEAAGKVGKF